jgi:hypothetical protein
MVPAGQSAKPTTMENVVANTAKPISRGTSVGRRKVFYLHCAWRTMFSRYGRRSVNGPTAGLSAISVIS